MSSSSARTGYIPLNRQSMSDIHVSPPIFPSGAKNPFNIYFGGFLRIAAFVFSIISATRFLLELCEWSMGFSNKQIFIFPVVLLFLSLAGHIMGGLCAAVEWYTASQFQLQRIGSSSLRGRMEHQGRRGLGIAVWDFAIGSLLILASILASIVPRWYRLMDGTIAAVVFSFAAA